MTFDILLSKRQTHSQSVQTLKKIYQKCEATNNTVIKKTIEQQ